jgi:hypothetical protein
VASNSSSLSERNGEVDPGKATFGQREVEKKTGETASVSRDDSDVLGAAADAVVAAAAAAANASGRADETDRAERTSPSSAVDLEGPALAARARALKMVSKDVNDSKVSEIMRDRSKQAEKEMNEFTPAALIAKSFQSAAEVRFLFHARPPSFTFGFSLSQRVAATLSCPAIFVPSQSFHAAKAMFARRRSLLNI